METNLQIIKNENNEKAVYGRDLHQALEIKTDYPKWFKRQLEHGFEANNDYTTTKSKIGVRHYEENHLLTLDMAKEGAMLAKTEMGKQVRRYFIEVEKREREVPLLGEALLQIGAEVNSLKLGQLRLEAQLKEIQSSEPLRPVEWQELRKWVNAKAGLVLGKAYGHKSLRQRVFAFLYGELRTRFDAFSYKAILRKDFQLAKELISEAVLPYALQLEIEKTNLATGCSCFKPTRCKSRQGTVTINVIR